MNECEKAKRQLGPSGYVPKTPTVIIDQYQALGAEYREMAALLAECKSILGIINDYKHTPDCIFTSYSRNCDCWTIAIKTLLAKLDSNQGKE